MGRRTRRSRRRFGGPVAWPRIAFVALPVVAAALLFLPQSVTDSLRVWTGPVFSPLLSATEDWSLDLAARSAPAGDPPTSQALEAQVHSLENALAEAAALLADYDRRMQDLGRLRQGLDGLPCRLTPARFLAPEVTGGEVEARLTEGFTQGIRRGAAVIQRRIDRGVREAIQQGEPVLTAAGLVGLVDEVGPMASAVRLLTDPRTNLMVQIITCRDGQWRAGPEGVARGSDDGALTVQGVSRTSDVAVGDFVVTSPSPESALPPYLIVGRIVRSNLKPADVFRELVVEPRVSPTEVRQVYVLSPLGAVEPRPVRARADRPTKP